VLTVGLGVVNQSFAGFPKGYDAYGHMSKVKFLVDNFPNVDWNYEWYSGQYFSEWSFPPLFHWLAAALAWLGMPIGATLLVLAAASFVVVVTALYGLVRVASGSRLAGLVAGLLVLGSGAFWVYVLEGGLYPRILGMAFVSVFAFLLLLHHATRSRVAFAGMVLALSAALSTHLLLGAIGVALAVAGIAVLDALSLRERVVRASALLLLSALVVAYFYLPFALAAGRPAPVPAFTTLYRGMAVTSLLGGAESLPAVMAVLVVVAIAIALRLRQLLPGPTASRTMLVMAAGAAACLLYAVAGLGASRVYIYNFQPPQAIFFAAWLLAAFVGLSLARVLRHRWAAGLAIGALLVQIAFTTPTLAAVTVTGDNPDERALENALPVDPGQRQYRVGVSWDAGSDWINSRVGVPQTRGYQQQGVINGEWQYWFETAVWSHDSNYDETSFLLDWFAVKQLFGGPDATAAGRFQQRPDLFTPAGSRVFQYLNAEPILSATSVRSALVVGDDASYDLVLRAVALSGFDSRSLVPVRGGDFVDDLTARDLAPFDLVILYGYRFHDPARAFGLLEAYVRGGGGLLIEGGPPALAQTANAPSPIPGAVIKRKAIGPDWKLTHAGQVDNDVALAGFAPAVCNGGPWGVSYMPKSSIASWAEPVLLSDGDPVVVAGELGRGRVTWSGMNLPYHAASTRTEVESRLLGEEIAWTAPRQSAAPEFTATFVNPQSRRVSAGAGATGVLFKESWVPNWQATVNGSDAKVYRAGPDFMYVPIPPTATSPALVKLDFVHTPPEIAGDSISVLTLVGILGWLALGLRRRRRGLP
jgi:hypothetical protein